MSLTAALSGFGLGIALISPIGAQNAYVLRTAVRAPRGVLAALVAMVALIDIALIAAGAAGAGALLDGRDWLRIALYATGIALLAPLGVRTLLAGLRGDGAGADELLGEPAGDQPSPGRRHGTVLAPAVGLTLLNPHVYLDTVAILGSAVASHAPDERLPFTLGAMTASIVWFSGLALLGALVLRRFGAPAARAIDIFGGLVMLVVAVLFAREAIHLL